VAAGFANGMTWRRNYSNGNRAGKRLGASRITSLRVRPERRHISSTIGLRSSSSRTVIVPRFKLHNIAQRRGLFQRGSDANSATRSDTGERTLRAMVELGKVVILNSRPLGVRLGHCLFEHGVGNLSQRAGRVFEFSMLHGP